MQTGSSTPDNILSQLLPTLIDLVHQLVEAVISGVPCADPEGLRSSRVVVRAIGDILKAEWKIPFRHCLLQLYHDRCDTGWQPAHPPGFALARDRHSHVRHFQAAREDGKAPFPTKESVEILRNRSLPKLCGTTSKGSLTNAVDIEHRSVVARRRHVGMKGLWPVAPPSRNMDMGCSAPSIDIWPPILCYRVMKYGPRSHGI